MSHSQEPLHDCPQCGRKNFTTRGLAAHVCKGGADNLSASVPEPGRQIVGPTLEPSLAEEFGQARIYVHALEGMAHGMAAIAVVLGAELQRLHKLFGVRAGRPGLNSQPRLGIKWADVVERELGVSDETARRWMHLAEQAKQRIPDFRPIAEKLLATPLGSLPDLQRAELVERTRKMLPEDGARQLMFDWGVVRKPKAIGGNTYDHSQKGKGKTPGLSPDEVRERLRTFCAETSNHVATIHNQRMHVVLTDAELDTLADNCEALLETVRTWRRTPKGDRAAALAEVVGQ